MAPIMAQTLGEWLSVEIQARGFSSDFLRVEIKRVSTSVLERQPHTSAERPHFAVFDLNIQLDNLRDAQIPECARSGLDRVLCRVLPRLRTRAYYFHQLVNGVGARCFIDHALSFDFKIPVFEKQ